MTKLGKSSGRGTTSRNDPNRSAVGPEQQVQASVLIRLHDEQIEKIDRWIAAQDGVVTRQEAIRRLVEMALDERSARKGGKGR